jgi:integrase/recombinase XerD
MLIDDAPASFLSIMTVHSPILFSDPDMLQKLIDEQFYTFVRSYIRQNEDEHGEYDYSRVSNIGMVYLFIHRRESNRKSNTKREYAGEIMQFLRHMTENGIDDIRQLKRAQLEAFQEWLAVRYPKTKTQAKKITILSSFLSWCYKEKYLKRDIDRGLVSVRLDKSQIPDREIPESSLNHAISFYAHDPKFRSLMMILATSGLRLNEVVTPLWGSLYYDEVRKKHYLRTTTKRDGERHAHIKEYVLQELVEYRRRLGLGTAINPNDRSPFYPNRSGKHYRLTSLSDIVTKKLAAAKLQTTHGQKTTAHYFRHYFAREAYNNGASVDRIAKTLGHESSRTTEQNYLSRDLKKEHDVSHFVEISGFEDDK